MQKELTALWRQKLASNTKYYIISLSHLLLFRFLVQHNMDLLPREIVQYIFSYAEPKSICFVGSTCRRLHELSLYDSIWAQHCHQFGVYEYNADSEAGPPNSYRDIYIRLLRKYGWMLGIWQGELIQDIERKFNAIKKKGNRSLLITKL